MRLGATDFRVGRQTSTFLTLSINKVRNAHRTRDVHPIEWPDLAGSAAV